MKLKKFVKPLCLILVVIVVIFICSNNSVFAALNPNYKEGATAPTANLDGIIKNDALGNAIGQLIYTVGNILEKFFTLLVQAVTGAPAFPWADKILFNAVPLLDINFINPDTNSLFGSAGGLQGIVRSVYFTILSLSITFFGIGVVVMAIRLVTTAIAEEKAKYKEAIMNWLIGLTLLFTIHYGISFIFYLNESLVEIASTIVTDQLKDSSIASGLQVDDTYKAKVVTNFCNNQLGGSYANFLSNVSDLTKALAFDFTHASAYTDGEKDQATQAMKYMTSSEDKINFAYYLISDENAIKTLGELKDVDLNKTPGGDTLGEFAQWVPFWNFGTGQKSYKNIIAVASWMEYVENTKDSYIDAIKDQINNGSSYVKERETFRLQCYNFFVTKTDSTKVNIIQDLGEYFKNAAWSVDVNGGQWKKNTASLQNALMYTILVVQSILYFFAYIKRLFFVIVLSLMAPAMIVYNFFVKSISGGGKGDVFGNWIKEFCLIVFTQTLQAFIFAIIIVIIIKANVNSGKINGVTDTNNKNIAVALIGVVALASLGKIEDLVKDMLGMKSSIHDSSMRGGMKSLMAGMAIGGAVKNRVFSNAGKLKSGISEAWSSGKARKAEENRYNKRLALYGFGGEDNGRKNGNGLASNNESTEQLLDKANEAEKNGDNKKRDEYLDKAVNSEEAAKNVNNSEQQKLNQKQFSLSDRVKLDELRNAHEDRLAEIKKKKNEGWKKIVSSPIETIGATTGAIAGASLGLATGDTKDVLAAAGIGSVAGDWAGEQAVNLSNFTKARVNDINSYVEKKKQTTAKQRKDNMAMYKKRKDEINKLLDKLPKDVSDIY